ncbi:hypothetical protein MTBBW1_620021 [Desulfamplus magnetovallimortis]|uniref:histidine kinase n=1 Tax=Desulfamplus magnetovallimortis TaxID=1246637 RepID=A0A1W1HIT8_9BACT|nr:hybrid sensor histidine kinase/response regulator [Desulfamplus magnetovallimortis]SLM32278.1 hypothetical protein MTBBW1_620021 [Desulfamplus magnetovallimortis]
MSEPESPEYIIMAFDRSAFISRFIEDAGDHLKQMEQGVLALEKNPLDKELLNGVFRSAHSIKGASRMMKFIEISNFAHLLEDIFDALRKKDISWSDELVNLLYQSIDTLSDMLEQLLSGVEPEPPESLLHSLAEAALPESSSSAASPSAVSPSAVSPSATSPSAISPSAISPSATSPSATSPSATFPSTANSVISSSSSSAAAAADGDGDLPLKKQSSSYKDSDLSEREKYLSQDADLSEREKYLSQDADLSEREKSLSQGADLSEREKSLSQGANLSERKHALSEVAALSEREDAVFQDSASGRNGKIFASENEINPEKRRGNDTVPAKSDESIRVSIKKLDDMINLMGELGILHRQFGRHIAQLSSLKSNNPEIQIVQKNIKEFLDNCHPLVTELMDRALGLRMQPLSTLFDTFYKYVRELSKECEKDVALDIKGGETEMDRKMIEKLKDPLLHMLRNCIDHGIESPETRIAEGKKRQGQISLSAACDGSKVIIRLRDDGKGIDKDKILEKALSKGLFDKDRILLLSEREILNLIFMPGFSTAEIITEISGRGVGMDVVRENLESDLGGSIIVETQPRIGSEFNISLPATIAVVHLFLIEVSGIKFAVQAGHIKFMIKVPLKDCITINKSLAIRMDDELVPLMFLSDLLDITMHSMAKTEDLLILVSGNTNETAGVVVDALISEERMIVKPLPPHMESFRMVSGAIISADNEVINVLNVSYAIEHAHGTASMKTKTASDNQEPVSATPSFRDGQLDILVVDDSVTTREIEKNILESYGYNVTLAIDGSEGLEKCRQFHYDLVITDVDMPRMDGFTLTENLRLLEGYRDIPIILVTSRERREDIIRGIDSGANAYIIKGDFDKNSLMETIENLIA